VTGGESKSIDMALDLDLNEDEGSIMIPLVKEASRSGSTDVDVDVDVDMNMNVIVDKNGITKIQSMIQGQQIKITNKANDVIIWRIERCDVKSVLLDILSYQVKVIVASSDDNDKEVHNDLSFSSSAQCMRFANALHETKNKTCSSKTNGSSDSTNDRDKANDNEDEDEDDDSSFRVPLLPDWVQTGRKEGSNWGNKLRVLEWEDDNTYRNKNGWKGNDLVHDKNSPVRVLDYYVKYGQGILNNCIDNNNNNDPADPETPQEEEEQETKSTRAPHCSRGGVGTTLTGVVHFTKKAESHQGYCHGGSMCSVLDDVIGWVGFLVTGECVPWSGFTVQVNSKLQRPVHVDSILLVQAKIINIERRKVSIEAVILDPKNEENNAIHATGTGLVVVNRGILPE
jgi:acyl-coenzyme A thioesterase PaaI-like protein